MHGIRPSYQHLKVDVPSTQANNARGVRQELKRLGLAWRKKLPLTKAEKKAALRQMAVDLAGSQGRRRHSSRLKRVASRNKQVAVRKEGGLRKEQRFAIGAVEGYRDHHHHHHHHHHHQLTMGWLGLVWGGLAWLGVPLIVGVGLGWFGVVWRGLGWFGVVGLVWGGLTWLAFRGKGRPLFVSPPAREVPQGRAERAPPPTTPRGG